MISQKYIEDSFGKEEQIQGIISEVNFGYTNRLSERIPSGEVYPPGRTNPQLNADINKLSEILTMSLKALFF